MVLFANKLQLKAQSGQKWSTSGNSANNGDFIGTTNNESLLLKANNKTIIRLKPNRDIIFKPFENIGTGLLSFDNDGKILPFTFNGNANAFLNGAGQFVNISGLSAWKIDPANNNLYQTTTGYVGIGTNNPQLKLHVAGDALVEGYVFTQGISIIGRAWGQKLYSDTIDVKLIEMDSLKSISGETRINGSASVSQKLGVGTKYPEAELDVRGNMALSGEARVDGYIKIPSLANANQELLIADGIGKINKISVESLLEKIYFDPNTPLTNDPCNPSSNNQNIAPITNSVASTSSIIAPTWKNGQGKMYLYPGDCQNLKLGVGTSNPQAMLHIKQNAIVEGVLNLGTPTLQNLDLLKVNGNATINGKLKVGANSVIIESLNNFGDILNDIYADANQNLFIQAHNKSTGKVGIGIDNQFGSYIEAKLHVNDDNTQLSAIPFMISNNDGHNIRFTLKNIASGYNWRTLAGDAGIFWGNSGGGFVIAPHENALTGIRIGADGVVDASGYKVNGVLIAGGGTSNQWTASGSNLYYNTGNVGIGTSNTGSYKLAVEGKVGAREFKVTQASPWPDFVFEKEYTLLSLEETEKFIQKNKHLPGVPSAKQIEENGGVDIGEMNRILLQKIEELTLQLINQQKQINELKK